MKIQCTRGCICDCLVVDGVDINELPREEKVKVLDKIQDTLLGGNIDARTLEGLLSQCCCYISCNDDLVLPSYNITEETYGVYLNGKRPEDILDIDKKGFITELITQLKGPWYSSADFIIWWFMKKYIGLNIYL